MTDELLNYLMEEAAKLGYMVKVKAEYPSEIFTTCPHIKHMMIYTTLMTEINNPNTPLLVKELRKHQLKELEEHYKKD